VCEVNQLDRTSPAADTGSCSPSVLTSGKTTISHSTYIHTHTPKCLSMFYRLYVDELPVVPNVWVASSHVSMLTLSILETKYSTHDDKMRYKMYWGPI